ncbi:GtrA family protein [Dietzia sp.]|uniref:GtrA family protein n=1 Tax=Dietzia sp. TaxID=1871616 RepID=UPI002FD99AE4
MALYFDVKSADEHYDGVRETAIPPEGVVDSADLPGRMGIMEQAVRFILVGGVSAVVDYGIYQLLMALFGLPYPVAKAISFVFGTLTAYALNRRYTFRSEPSWRKFVTTMAVYAVMFLVQWGIATGVTALLLDHDVSKFWATTIGFVLGQGVATVTNFVVQRAIIFRE